MSNYKVDYEKLWDEYRRILKTCIVQYYDEPYVKVYNHALLLFENLERRNMPKSKLDDLNPNKGLHMFELHDEIVNCAIAWWKNKRPLEFSEIEHIKNPAVNTASYEKKRLAMAVAQYIHYMNDSKNDK